MLQFDHIAIACADLEAGQTWLEEQLGVMMQPGGQHGHFGTHNMLLGLADGLYLEVIAIDPSAAPTGRPTWFGLDHFTGPPRPANWICRCDDLGHAIADAPVPLGDITPLARGDLRWEMVVPADGSLPMDGGYPTLIKWAHGTVLPADRLPESGCRLARWEVIHPQAEMLRDSVPLADDRVVYVAGDAPAFRAHIDTPGGVVVLG